MKPHLNLNADLGESFGAWRMGDDLAMLQLVQSANIACGFHAGDALVMRQTVKAALQAGVSLGAHPSYPDLQGFGRRALKCSAEEIEAFVLYQLGALDGSARANGARVTHVKPHGALSNEACRDQDLAGAIARAVKAYDARLILLAPALSALAEAGARENLPTALEIYADRAYEDDGQLTPRGEEGAVLRDAQQSLAHVESMLAAGGLTTRFGNILPTPIHSICVHGDGPEAVATARALHARLAQRFALAPLPSLFASGETP
jgi:5-oxoprolinase (ATP-hydrolysing) subunit A